MGAASYALFVNDNCMCSCKQSPKCFTRCCCCTQATQVVAKSLLEVNGLQ